ncbi:MAG: energy transducer TonB [Saprospiraceae bacterium]
MKFSIKNLFKHILPILLFLTLSTNIFSQNINQLASKGDMPEPVQIMAIPIDTIMIPYMTAFDWVVEKEVWYDPMDFSFYVITDTRMTDEWNSFSSKTYKLNQVDRPPFYGDKCLKAEDSWECSKKNIAETIKSNIDYPNPALRKNHDGKEVVTFTINEYGKVEGNYKVLSKDKPCKECAQAAVDAVATLKNWYPAMKDGKFVKTQISIPVVFEIIER